MPTIQYKITLCLWFDDQAEVDRYRDTPALRAAADGTVPAGAGASG